MDIERSKPAPGRPRGFCADKALAAALRIFWTKGYEGASLSELTAAMAISRPSLYAAFGNKEALFRQVLDLYERDNSAFMGAALAMPTARGVAERILQGALKLHTADGEARGCLFTIHSVACGAGAEPARREIATRSAAFEGAVEERFRRAEREGDLAEGIEPVALARYLIAVVRGMAVQADTVDAGLDLEGIVDLTLRLWPSR